MSRPSKESLPGGRNATAGSQHLRRGRGLAAGRGSRDGEESLDLFARIHRNPLISSTTESGGQNAAGQHKLERVSIGSAKLWRSGGDDLLSSDIGKSDYDWLLTPPGTPLVSSSDASEHQPSSTAPRSSSNVRSISATKASRLSVSQSENSQFNRATRSGSTTHTSLSSTISSSYFSNNNRTSVLNTSSASVTSRPTTPGKRPTAAYTSRTNSISASHPVASRPSTPSKTRTTSTTYVDKPRQLQNSRPSTPTARPQVPCTNSNASSSTASARSNSRPSTPGRRNPTPTPARTTSSSRSSTPNRRTPVPAAAPTMTRSLSVGHTPTTNNRNPASRSRPSSPAPVGRVPPQPLAPDFLHDIPPNLRTKLPERPISASKQRPGVPLTVQANQNSEAAAAAPASTNRRQSSPIVTRGRLSDSSPKDQSESNGHNFSLPEIKKTLVSEATVRRPSKPALSTESTGFGRTISKKSLDMALRHMDIRQGIRGASLFPQSIRPTTSKGQTGPMTDLVAPAVDKVAPLDDETMPDLTSRETESNKGMISGDSNSAISEDGDGVVSSAEREPVVAKVNEDIYQSSGYDAIQLKDGSKNLNWLHSIEDKSHQSRVFDHRFKPLPEPFSLV